jgi:hypothetical protein
MSSVGMAIEKGKYPNYEIDVLIADKAFTIFSAAFLSMGFDVSAELLHYELNKENITDSLLLLKAILVNS